MYSWNSSSAMHQNVSTLESIIDKVEGLIEMRCHFIARNIECVDDFVVNIVLFGVVNIEHGAWGQNYIFDTLPEVMFFCLRSCILDAA